MKKKHLFQTRLRAFQIWQKLGLLPWKKAVPEGEAAQKGKKGDGAFYKGAFDSIPFLNDDAKRTFTHLLLRPGYMIRDYIRGDHERYLAPLTSLIIFYAFFALVSAVLQPVQHSSTDAFMNELSKQDSTLTETYKNAPNDANVLMRNVFTIVQRGYVYLNLDKYPDAVDTRGESALAALEGSLRSQGIPLFLGEFILMWLSMSIALRRFRLGMSATAAASAYVLCQFSFFMLFALLLSFGKSTSINVLLMLFLLTVDIHQMLDVKWKKALWLGVKTGLWYGFLFITVLVTVSLLVLLIAWFRAV